MLLVAGTTLVHSGVSACFEGSLGVSVVPAAFEAGRYPTMHQIYEVALLGGWDDEGQGMEKGSKALTLIQNIATHISE